jgi:hypothetical protein
VRVDRPTRGAVADPAPGGPLDRIGLVATIDGRPTASSLHMRQSRVTFPWLPVGHLRWLTSRPVAALWLVVLAAAAVALAVRPPLRPGLGDLVWTDSAAVVLVVDAVIASLVIFLHELGHLLVARAYGVPGTITVSTRLTVLVAQTDVTGAWALPRRRRVLVYLAGTATDLLVAALCTLAAVPLDPAGTVATALRATVISLAMAAALQWAFFLRTDGYFLVQDLAGCRNLYGDATRLLKYGAARLARRAGATDPRAHLPARERRAVTLYAPFMAVGATLTVGLFVGVSLPLLVRLVLVAVGDVSRGIGHHAVGRPARRCRRPARPRRLQRHPAHPARP